MWCGVLNLQTEIFWAIPVGMFSDTIAAYQIAHGAKEKSKKQKGKENQIKNDGLDDDMRARLSNLI